MIARMEMPGLTFREMRRDDLSVVVGIENEAYPFPWTEGIFRDCLRVGYCCVVLDVAGESQGYGVMSIASAEAHLLNICIRPSRQRRGLGGDLLKWLLQRAREGSAQEVFLEVRRSNVGALAMYKQAGFNQIGLRRNYYRADNGREDAVVLSLPISKEG